MTGRCYQSVSKAQPSYRLSHAILYMPRFGVGMAILRWRPARSSLCEGACMIEVSHLQKVFGTFHAVHDLSFSVSSGEVVALLGPNGAGKTTTVRMLAAILKPTRGEARIAGYDVVRQAREVRRTVGLLTEFPGLYHRMLP